MKRSHRENARIGDIAFEYADPAVSVDTSSNTVEHETIDDQIIVQSLGRTADKITVTGVATDDEVGDIDDLVKDGVISVRTERWRGTAVCTSTMTDFMRALDDGSRWLYEFQIDLIEVDEAEWATGHHRRIELDDGPMITGGDGDGPQFE